MGEVYTINGVYTPRMTTREALLKAVLAAPDDDLPRLVFADHLEENGESERANWIRYDIAYPHAGFSDLCGKGDIFPYLGLPSLPPVRVNPHHPTDTFCRSWMWGDSEDLGVVFHDLTRGMDYRTERGFIHTVRATLADWLKHGPAVVREHPVAKVVLTDREPYGVWDGTFAWFRRTAGNDDGSELTPDVFKLLEGHTRFEPGDNEIGPSCHFPTREAAISALSAACLKWAKSQPV